jgi:hypothetical protein
MATRTTVALQDDLEGGPADQTVQFGLDGSDYEIDLNIGNIAEFRRQLAPFLDRARIADSRDRPGRGRTVASRQRSSRIRAWARDQGIQVSDRGRLPASITRRYEAATTAPLGRTSPCEQIDARRCEYAPCQPTWPGRYGRGRLSRHRARAAGRPPRRLAPRRGTLPWSY